MEVRAVRVLDKQPADTVVPGIGRARLGHRTPLKVRVYDWDPIRAEHLGPAASSAASTGRTHDRTRPMLQQRQNVLAKGAVHT